MSHTHTAEPHCHTHTPQNHIVYVMSHTHTAEPHCHVTHTHIAESHCHVTHTHCRSHGHTHTSNWLRSKLLTVNSESICNQTTSIINSFRPDTTFAVDWAPQTHIYHKSCLLAVHCTSAQNTIKQCVDHFIRGLLPWEMWVAFSTVRQLQQSPPPTCLLQF